MVRCYHKATILTQWHVNLTHQCLFRKMGKKGRFILVPKADAVWATMCKATTCEQSHEIETSSESVSYFILSVLAQWIISQRRHWRSSCRNMFPSTRHTTSKFLNTYNFQHFILMHNALKSHITHGKLICWNILKWSPASMSHLWNISRNVYLSCFACSANIHSSWYLSIWAGITSEIAVEIKQKQQTSTPTY